jgi:protoporphyrinogen oxidase
MTDVKEPTNKSDSGRVVIIGAGPAGLTAAYKLSKAGKKSIVLEKDRIVGGISRTVNYKNYLFDIGGHRFFTKIDAVRDMWNEVLGQDFLHRIRMSRIYYNEKFFYYPLRPLNALSGLGVWNSTIILFSYLYSHLFPYRQEETFEHWVSNRFGRRLYNTFFKTYTEKVWGIPCNEIRAEWAAQRIKGLSLMSAVRNALINQNKKGKAVIKTLIDSFEYPKFGPGMLWDTVADMVNKDGSEVCLGAEVDGILWDKDNHRIEAVEMLINGNKKVIRGTDFISSMPIRELIQKFRPGVPEDVLLAANSLSYRDFLTVALIVNRPNLFPDNWIYVHDPDVRVGRIQNFKNWSPHMVPDEGKSCVGLEYFCFEGDDLWSASDDELIELGKREMEQLGLLKAADVEDGSVVRMKKAYPSYDSKYQEMLTVIRTFLDGIRNIQLVGRNGMHRYNNQDHSMLTAMLAVENIGGAHHDLWKVNDEQEYHEEQKIISDEIIMKTFARIDKLGLATALGVVSGGLLFIATLWLIIKGGEVVGPRLQLVGQYFVGYTVTVKGAFIGLGYGFGWGFLVGWMFAYFRNLIIASYLYGMKKKAEMLSFRDFLDHF